jgi:hypothetical protein
MCDIYTYWTVVAVCGNNAKSTNNDSFSRPILMCKKTPYLHQLQSPGFFCWKKHTQHPIPSGGGGLPIAPIYFISCGQAAPLQLRFLLENQRRLCQLGCGITYSLVVGKQSLVVGASSAGTNRVTLRGLIRATRIFP